MTTDQKLAALRLYAQNLRQRLQAPVPQEHLHRPEIYKDMLELDLKKTMKRIEALG